MSLSETFMALQTGVIDGQENPLSQIHSQKFHEVQKYLSLTGHVYTPAYLLAGAARWRALPRGMQEVLSARRKTCNLTCTRRPQSSKSGSSPIWRLRASRSTARTAIGFVAAGAPLFAQFGAEVPGGSEMIEAALASAAE